MKARDAASLKKNIVASSQVRVDHTIALEGVCTINTLNFDV
jgi:hypothetical protein